MKLTEQERAGFWRILDLLQEHAHRHGHYTQRFIGAGPQGITYAANEQHGAIFVTYEELEALGDDLYDD